MRPTKAGVEKTGSPPLPQWEAVSVSNTVCLNSAERPCTGSTIQAPHELSISHHYSPTNSNRYINIHIKAPLPQNHTPIIPMIIDWKSSQHRLGPWMPLVSSYRKMEQFREPGRLRRRITAPTVAGQWDKY